MQKETINDKEFVVVKMEIGTAFFQHLHDVLGKELPPIEHIRNALELYANIAEGINENKIPALVDPEKLLADKLTLPPVLALLKHEKELEHNKTIDLKRGFI